MRKLENLWRLTLLVVILLEVGTKSYAIDNKTFNQSNYLNEINQNTIENNISKNCLKEGESENLNEKKQVRQAVTQPDTYVGNINCELKKFSMKKAGNGAAYINGEIVIVEWVDGKSTVPEVLPKIKLKSADGNLIYESFITPTGTNTYYFDQYIEDIDHGKEYIYELESGNPKNISPNKSMNITIPNQELGMVKSQKARVKNSKLIFVPDTYVGNINSELKKFSMKKAGNGAAYINGEIVIVEWVDGKSTVPEVLPKIKLKSTDGNLIYESFITPTGTNTYYFDQYIEDIDHSKEYSYELMSGNPKNVSPNKSMNITIPNQKLGMVKEQKAKIENNKLIFVPDTYVGNLNSELKRFSMRKAANGATYISGEIVIVEWIDGKSTVPNPIPKIHLKSIDGSLIYESFITPTGTNTYYFDQYIEDIDHSKEYIYEIESSNPKNISIKNKMQITIKNQELGIVKDFKVKIENNILKFGLNTYIGDVTNSLIEFNVQNNEKGYSYISGTLEYTEWVNGEATISKTNPKIRLLSKDGEHCYSMFVKKLSGNTYYFDLWIEGILDSSKIYYIETESDNLLNVSQNRCQKLDFNEKTGEYKNFRYTFQLKQNQEIEVDINTYKGDINATLEEFELITDPKNYSFIKIKAKIQELVNGNLVNLEFAPDIRLKSTDGSSIITTELIHGNESEYEVEISLDDKIDANKEYFIEVESGDLRNISVAKIANMDFRLQLGEYKNFKYTLTLNDNNRIQIKQESYIGSVATQIVNLNLLQSGYIAGESIVVEWVDGKSTVPVFNPIIKLKSVDGLVEKEMFVKQKSGNTYYFDLNIRELNFSKNYQIEISSGDLRNISASQVKILEISDRNIGSYGVQQASVQNNVICFRRLASIQGTYGSSGLKIAGDARGSDLRYYQIGSGPNVAFMVFEAHGFEDLWDHDGQELIEIAEKLKTKLVNMNDQNIQDKWTIYIIPEANPDGVKYGWSNNGPGRQTLYGAMENDNHKGIDMNRCWQISGAAYTTYTGRNYNGSEGFSAYEARSLRDFLLNHKAINGQTILVELHGWTNQVIGDQEMGAYYKKEFPTCRETPSYGIGYLINWARASLGANGKVARTALIELPSAGITDHQSVVNAGYADKFINATINLLRGII